MPVWPTCWVCGRQPSDVTTRETPTTPPSSDASSSSGPNPSALPTPRPPPTTTRALASEAPPAPAGASAARTARSPSVERRRDLVRDGSTRRVGGRRGTRVGRRSQQCHRRVEHRLLEQQPGPALSHDLERSRRVTTETATQFAAIGRPVIAPTCASTSLPRSVPAATTADAPSASAASARPHASGA